MSIRITLTDFEIEQLVSGLAELRSQGNGSYEVTKVGRNWYDKLIDKLNGQHPRSVETLGVSGDGDKASIAQWTSELT